MCLTCLTFRGTIAVRLSLIHWLSLDPDVVCPGPCEFVLSISVFLNIEYTCWTVTLYLLVFHVLVIFAAHHSHWARSLSASFSFFIPKKKKKVSVYYRANLASWYHSSQLTLMKFNRLKVFKVRIWSLDRGENKFAIERRICREHWSFL